MFVISYFLTVLAQALGFSSYEQDTSKDHCLPGPTCNIYYILAILPYSIPESTGAINFKYWALSQRSGPSYEYSLKKMAELINSDDSQIPNGLIKVLTVDCEGTKVKAMMNATNLYTEYNNIIALTAFTSISAETAIELGRQWNIPVLINDDFTGVMQQAAALNIREDYSYRAINYSPSQLEPILAWLRIVINEVTPDSIKKLQVWSKVAFYTDLQGYSIHSGGVYRNKEIKWDNRLTHDEAGFRISNIFPSILRKIAEDVFNLNVSLNEFKNVTSEASEWALNIYDDKDIVTNSERTFLAFQQSNSTIHIHLYGSDDAPRVFESFLCRIFKSKRIGFIFLIPSHYYDSCEKDTYSPDSPDSFTKLDTRCSWLPLQCIGECQELGCSASDILQVGSIFSLSRFGVPRHMFHGGGINEVEVGQVFKNNSVLHTCLNRIPSFDRGTRQIGIPVLTYNSMFHPLKGLISSRIESSIYYDMREVFGKNMIFSNDIKCRYSCIEGFSLPATSSCLEISSEENKSCSDFCISNNDKSNRLSPFLICTDKRLKKVSQVQEVFEKGNFEVDEEKIEFEDMKYILDKVTDKKTNFDQSHDKFIYPSKSFLETAAAGDVVCHLSLMIQNLVSKSSPVTEYKNGTRVIKSLLTLDDLDIIYDELLNIKFTGSSGVVEFVEKDNAVKYFRSFKLDYYQINPQVFQPIAKSYSKSVTLTSVPSWLHTSGGRVITGWNNALPNRIEDECKNGLRVDLSCIPCNKGTVFDTSQKVCVPCKTGYYSDKSQFGIRECKKCEEGYTTYGVGQSECIVCGTNNLVDTFDTKNCTPEKTEGCPQGLSLIDGSCKKCSLGYVLINKKCEKCPKGSFAYETGDQYIPSVCVPCGPGEYQDKSGESSCQQCPKNSYSSDSSTTSCTPCPADRNSTKSSGASSISQCICEEGKITFPIRKTIWNLYINEKNDQKQFKLINYFRKNTNCLSNKVTLLSKRYDILNSVNMSNIHEITEDSEFRCIDITELSEYVKFSKELINKL